MRVFQSCWHTYLGLGGGAVAKERPPSFSASESPQDRNLAGHDDAAGAFEAQRARTHGNAHRRLGIAEEHDERRRKARRRSVHVQGRRHSFA